MGEERLQKIEPSLRDLLRREEKAIEMCERAISTGERLQPVRMAVAASERKESRPRKVSDATAPA